MVLPGIYLFRFLDFLHVSIGYIEIFVIFVDALSDILDALKEGENFQRLEEAKQSAGNDMLRTMQIVFPVATNIQMEVIERYGFPSDGEGKYFLIQLLD